MRHVTDGELHAFLDGGLDLLPDGRGEEIRNHIAECPVCRERLQDEEAIRSRAESILEAPNLSETTLPTFEELRERAEAPLPQPSRDREERRHYRGPLRGLPLAWAATIVLALGVGWMGSEVFRIQGGPRAPADFVESRSSFEVMPDDPTTDSLSESGLLLESAAPETAPAGAEARVDAAVGEAAEGLQRPPLVSGAVVEAEGTDEIRTRQEPATPPEPSNLEADRMANPQAMLREALILPDSPTAAANLVVTAARQGGEAGVSPQDVVMETDSLRDALGVPELAVPGLKVVSIGWEERVPGERTLLIRQVLSPGDTLELRYLGLLLGTDPEPRRAAAAVPLEEVSGVRVYANVLEASLPPGWSQVVMERERGLLVARAPTDEDHLKALLKTLR
ncbi:MAG: hypothetical protein PVJ76_06420 [Gemmatimonadota bacterium]|jgi:hypothetical protein